jgi:multiple sugar transport system ATP-binding protein
MDEPLSNLDAKLRVEMRAYLATLHQRLRTTTLYVTHDQTEAMTMGDRVAVMRDGRLQQVDRPQALYDRPVNLFVAGFIGSPAMNLVRSRLSAHGRDVHADLGDTRLPLPPALLRRRPTLTHHVGREVVLGIRPEDIEDAALAPSTNGSSLDVRVSLAEAMGAQLIAHFPVAAGPVVTSSTVVAAVDGEDEDEAAASLRLLIAGDRGNAIFTARLNPRSRARTGGSLRVTVDPERLHFFDPETEEAIW